MGVEIVRLGRGSQQVCWEEGGAASGNIPCETNQGGNFLQVLSSKAKKMKVNRTKLICCLALLISLIAF